MSYTKRIQLPEPNMLSMMNRGYLKCPVCDSMATETSPVELHYLKSQYGEERYKNMTGMIPTAVCKSCHRAVWYMNGEIEISDPVNDDHIRKMGFTWKCEICGGDIRDKVCDRPFLIETQNKLIVEKLLKEGYTIQSTVGRNRGQIDGSGSGHISGYAGVFGVGSISGSYSSSIHGEHDTTVIYILVKGQA